MHPAVSLGIYSVRDLQAHYESKNSNGYWFSPSAMKFFRTKIYEGLWYTPDSRVLFITSEQRRSGEPRRYTVREYSPTTGDIRSIEFMGHKTLASAKREADSLGIK